MSYRKLKADYLFDGFQFRDSGTVLVCREDGTIETILDESLAGEGVEKWDGIITPGFINCHCHLELSHLKGRIPEKMGLVDFVFSVIGHRQLSAEFIREAIRSGEEEMQSSGIVAVGDICNTSDTQSAKSSGRLLYYNFIELFGWSPGQASTRFEGGKLLFDLFYKKTGGNKHLSITPHAPYSVSKELWDLLRPGFQDKTISIHNQESAAENEFFLSGGGDLNRMYSLMKMDISHFKALGTHSPPDYLPKMKRASKILLVHNTYMDEPDLEEAMHFNKNLFFCFCPHANLYIEDRLPDIPVFLKNKCRIVLGTDSLASNHQLSILEEMKIIKRTFPDIPTAIMLQWATSNGADALDFEESTGDFSKGKKPGVVIIENILYGEIQSSSTSRRIL